MTDETPKKAPAKKAVKAAEPKPAEKNEAKPEAPKTEAPKPAEKEVKAPAEKKEAKPAPKAPAKKAPAKKASKAPAKEASKPEAPKPVPMPVPKPTSVAKAFDRWDVTGIKVEDPGLVAYVTLEPRIVPKTGARYAGNRFHKSKVFIVERLINHLMVVGHKGKKHKTSSGHNTGRAATVYQIVEDAFILIEQRTKKNPVAVFVQAVENAAPREEIVNIEYGGARYPKAVECAPQRRVDVALRMMAQGAYTRSFNKKKSASQALAEEILAAASSNPQSQAISRKVDLERAADSSR